MGGNVEGGWLLRLVLGGFLVVCEWRRFGVSLDVDFGGYWLVLVVWGVGVVLGVV